MNTAKGYFIFNDDLMKELVSDGFVVSKLWHKMVGSTDWLEIILKKAIK